MDLVEVIHYYLRQDPYYTWLCLAWWAVYERKVGQGSPPHNTSSVFAQFFSPLCQAPQFGQEQSGWSLFVLFLRDPNVYFLYKNTAAVFRGPCAIPRHWTWIILGVYNSDIQIAKKLIERKVGVSLVSGSFSQWWWLIVETDNCYGLTNSPQLVSLCFIVNTCCNYSI